MPASRHIISLRVRSSTRSRGVANRSVRGAIMTTEKSSPLTDGCQCGAVRYEPTAHPGRAYLCHCRMCEKFVGGPFYAFAPVRLEHFIWTRRAPASFASSSLASREFCGTPLTLRYDNIKWIGATVGSLYQPQGVAPTNRFGVESRIGWLNSLGALPVTTTDANLSRDAHQKFVNRQHPDHDTPAEWPGPQ